jgi:hypothetical protein
MEIKVKEISSTNKSVAEIEEKLLKDAESKNEAANVAGVETSNESSTTTPQQESVQSEDQAPKESTPSSELKEEDVLSYIKDRYKKEFTSVEQLFDQKNDNEELPEDVKGYFEYKKKTGRGIEDYVKLNRDFSSMDEDQLLSEYLLASGDALDSEDVEVLMDEYIYDEEIDEQSDIKKKKLAKKKAIVKAKKFFETQKEMYKEPVESTGQLSAEEQKEFDGYKDFVANAKSNEQELKRKRAWFVDKTNEVFTDFKGFDFKIGDTNFTYTPGEGSKLKEIQSDSTSFIKQFMDSESGLLKDAVGYHRALAIAMNPEKFATFFYEQGKSDATEDVTKKIKNVSMSTRQAPEVGTIKGGMQIKSLSTPSSRGLRIKSKKK